MGLKMFARAAAKPMGLGLIAAVLWTWGPQLPLLSEVPWGRVKAEYAVLAAAILGYHLKK